jgi:hypothetical protein
MPAQASTRTATNPVVYYVELDRAPDMVTDLVDEETLEPIDLTAVGTTVVVNIAWAAPHGSFYTSPRDRIVSEGPCVIDPDQVTNPGRVSWTPDEEDLTPPGQFVYQHQVDSGGLGLIQTVPANTYNPMIIRANVGGRSFNKQPIP